MCNISVPEKDSPVSGCLIGKAPGIFMKQANKQTQRVCKLPSEPSFSSRNFKLSRSLQADGSQDLVFRMKAVRKWQSRRFSSWGEGGTWVHRAVHPSSEKDSAAGIRLLNMQDKMYKNIVKWDCNKTSWISLNVSLYVQVQLCTPTHTAFISVCDHINTCRCDTEEIPVLRHEYGAPHLYLLPGSHNELVQSVGSLPTSHTHLKTNTEGNSILVTTFNRMSRHRTKTHEREGVWNSHHYFTVLHMFIQN